MLEVVVVVREQETDIKCDSATDVLTDDPLGESSCASNRAADTYMSRTLQD